MKAPRNEVLESLSVGERLRYVREEILHMSQEQFAEKVECSRANVAMWEAGTHRPNIDRLAIIEQLTGIRASSWARPAAPAPAAEVEG